MPQYKDCRINFLNTQIDNLTKQEALTVVKKLIEADRPAYCVTPNVDHLVRLESDGDFAEVYRDADLILADGQPLIWISRLLGTPIREKISGSDFFPLVCRLAAEEGYSVYLLGAAKGVAKRAAKNLERIYPGIKIAGYYSPSIGFEKDAEEVRHIIEKVNASGADILCLGLGAPKQEKFFYRYRHDFKPLVAFHVGATIDFIAGNTRRAPVWMRRCGLEWFHRLCQEPRRLWKRYLVDDMRILAIVRKYGKKPKYQDHPGKNG